MHRTGLVLDDRYQLHDTGQGHPERAERLAAIAKRLEQDGITSRTVRIPPKPADLESIAQIHDRRYIERVREACEHGERYIDTPDSAICTRSYEIALLAVGGLLELADAVATGRCANGFAAVRPPGHHAERNRSMGFCLFNNVAIAAKHLQQKHGYQKILIVDWDVHHCNGTQHSFDRDPTVFVCSLHQHPSTCYPGTGWPHEIGEGRAKGTKMNLPMSPGLGDEAYRRAFQESFLPAARKFRPNFILISTGFDAHTRDPLAGMNLTIEGFNYMQRATLDLAAEQCGGRAVSTLEGGYNLQALAECVSSHVNIMIEYAGKVTTRQDSATQPASRPVGAAKE
jgi:acetoin utilization deacetylase AcuC-like enzyme